MEDDRRERPFIVLDITDDTIKHIWVVLIDVFDFKIIQHHKMYISQEKLKFLEGPQDIFLCASNSLKIVDGDGKKDDKHEDKDKMGTFDSTEPQDAP